MKPVTQKALLWLINILFVAYVNGTTPPAQLFGLSDRTGRIAVGMDADIVLLKSDPANDILSFDRVAYTILQGKIIFCSQKY
jgi:imidazolonepropionase-like amidohydrolase